MLSNTLLADLLTQQFNAQGMAADFAFAIYPDAKELQKERTIQGILVAGDSDAMPVPSSEGFVSRKYPYTIYFTIVDRDTGFRTAAFNKVVAAAINTMQGESFAIGEGQGILTFSVPNTQGTGTIPAIGEGVYSILRLNVSYSENATTTSSKVWLLDGVRIPYLEEGVDLDVEGATNNVYGLKATQSLPIKQTKYYKFTLPYDNSNPIPAQLQRDMLEGDMTKTYTLSYYDGVAYTQEKPYATTVSLFRTVDSSALRPSTSQFTAIFADSDDGTSGSIQYELALLDNPFDENSVNVRWFDGRESQQAWYAEKIEQGAPYSPIKAPNLNSLTLTQQVYIVPTNTNISLNELITKNYAVIRATDKPTGQVLYYYYYYIQTANGGANNMILVDLKMDTVQTYYFDPNIVIPDCLIERAHLNRWVDNGDGTVSFDNRPSSPLFEREAIKNLAHYTKSRKKIVLKYNTNQDSINEWISQNIVCWVYVFLTKKSGRKIINTKNKGSNGTMTSIVVSNYDDLFNNVICPYFVLCYPIYTNSNQSFYVDGHKVDKRGYESLMLGLGNPDAEIIGMKLSFISPIKPKDYLIGSGSNQISISSNGLHLFTDSEGNFDGFFASFYNENVQESCLCVKEQNIFSALPADINIDVTTTFLKNQLNGNRDKTFNPKLLGSDYITLSLTNDTQSFDYDIQKLGTKLVSAKYTEPITPDLTRSYLRVLGNSNSVYNEYATQNNTGLVGLLDNSMPWSVNNLDIYLSNNKNFFLQRNISSGIEIAKGAVSLATGVVGQDPKKLMSGSSDLIGSAMNRFQSDLTLDNMKQSPESVHNSSGNFALTASVNSCSLYYELHSAIEEELVAADDYMYMNGFIYMRLSKIKVFDNIRHYFNFIQADISNIFNVSISNDARNDIRRRFASGIRFWKDDEIQYEKENYEEWLNN